MLEHSRHELLPYLTIAAFAGLRQAEAGRLDWSEIKDDHILIMAGVSKTKVKRQAPLLPNLAEWLRPFRQEAGRVVPFNNITLQLSKLAENAGLNWKRNGLRHSFGSHRLALEKDPAAVAYEMGNSREMIFKHYRRVVTESQAHRWFAVYPDSDMKPNFRLPAKPDLQSVTAAA
jgi:integrase